MNIIIRRLTSTAEHYTHTKFIFLLMSNESGHSNLTHPLVKSVPIVLASLVGISTIGWLVQTIRIRFQPRRLTTLVLLSHLSLFIELVLRAVYFNDASRTRTIYTVSGMLLAITHRALTLSNYEFILQLSEFTACLSRTINISAVICCVSSAVIMSISSRMLYNTRNLELAFVLRQTACAMIFAVALLFYSIWFATKPFINKSKQAMILLITSSLSCLVISIYLIVTSVPYYYYQSNEIKFGFYLFQIIPQIIALFTWTICHPGRHQFTHTTAVPVECDD